MPNGLRKIYSGFAISAPGANTDLISGGIVCANYPGMIAFRVEIAMVSGTASVLRATQSQTSAGVTTTKVMSLNNGIAISAACLSTFDVQVDPEDTWNLQIVTNAAINSLKVYAIYQGVN